MLQLKRHFYANDNIPRKLPIIRKSFYRAGLKPVEKTPSPTKAEQYKVVADGIMPMLALLSGAYAFLQNLPLTSLLWPSFIIGTFLVLTTTQSEPESRLRNISGLLIVACLATGLAAFFSINGLALIAMELALLVTTLALVIGWIFKSKPTVLLSIFSALFYLASLNPELGLTTGLTDQVSLLGAGILPWLILGQVILARKVQSSAGLFLAIIAGYIWLGVSVKDMPLSAIAGLLFAIATTHYWLSKVWAESGNFGANIHRICAWVIALSSAVYVQSIWLNIDSGQAKPFWSPNGLWWSGLGIALFTLFLATLMRYKTSHITLLGIFIICLAVAALPIAIAKPDLYYLAFEAIPGLDARPGLGLVIGAIIIATGFIWVMEGLKRDQGLSVAIGTTAIAIETFILFRPDKFNVDLGVTFILSLICALCIGGLIAGSAPDETHSPRNYA